MIPEPEQMDVIHEAMSAILRQHSTGGDGAADAMNPEKIGELLQMVFSEKISEVEFRKVLDGHFHSPS